MPGKPGQGALQKARRGLLALIRQHLGIGQATVIVDGQVQCFPANAPTVVARIAGDAIELRLAAVREVLQPNPVLDKSSP